MSDTEKRGSKAQMLLIAAIVCIAIVLPFAKRSADNSPEYKFSTKPMAAAELSDYKARIEVMIAGHTVRHENGVPVVHPPAGSDLYLLARNYDWGNFILELEKGAEYRLHLASADVRHAIQVKELDIRNIIAPGEEKIVELKPGKAGSFAIVCGEFCGTNHGSMIGRLIVTDPDAR